MTTEVPRPVSCSSTQPSAGFSALRIAPVAPVTIITGRSGSTSALAIGPPTEMTPNVPAMTGTVASCAATVTANGSTISRGPGNPRGDRRSQQQDAGRTEKRQLEAGVLDQLRRDPEHQRRDQREHRHRVGAPRAGDGEHCCAGHERAPNRGGPGAADEHVGGDHRQRHQEGSPSRPFEDAGHGARPGR